MLSKACNVCAPVHMYLALHLITVSIVLPTTTISASGLERKQALRQADISWQVHLLSLYSLLYCCYIYYTTVIVSYQQHNGMLCYIVIV